MKIKLLSDGAKVPCRANEFAAGYDLYVPKDCCVAPGRNLIPLDIKIELDPSTEAQIRPRSGFSYKGIEGSLLLDNVKMERFDADVIIGTLDEDYRGNVGVILYSKEMVPFYILKGTRIAQMVIHSYCASDFVEVDDLSNTARGEGGYGHTGTL